MEFEISRLFTLSYYLNTNPGGDFLVGYGLLIFFILVLFSRSIVKGFAPHDKYFRKSLRKKFGKFIVLGVLGIILVTSRFSGVPWFSMRLWLYLTLIATLVLLLRTYQQIRGEYKKRIGSVEREKQKRGEL